MSSEASSPPIGEVMETSGKPTDEPATPTLKPDDSSAPSELDSRTANNLSTTSSKLGSPPPSPLISNSPKNWTTSILTATILGRITTKVTFSLIGEPFTRYTPCSHPPRVQGTAISSSPRTTTTRPLSVIRTDGTRLI